MNWHAQGAPEVLKKLKVEAAGLTSAEAATRLEKHGPNELPDVGQKHWIWILLKQFRSLLILILFAAALISWFTDHRVDTYVIFFVIAVNAAIGFVQEMKAQRAVASLRGMLQPKARVLRDGDSLMVPAREVVPGDVIILEEGDSIPADARLIEAKNLRAIEAPLTGESVPVNKNVDALPEATGMSDRHNMVRKGTFIAGGFAKAVVTATAMDTAIGEIAKSLDDIKIGRTNFQKKTDVLARHMAFIALGSAVLLFVVAYFFQEGTELSNILLISIAALVSSIPEGLPAVLAIVLAVGANRMARRNAIISEFTATETLGAVTTILTDKTGTLTQNTLTVRRVSVPGAADWEVSGEGWEPFGKFDVTGAGANPKGEELLAQILDIAAWSNNAHLRRGDKDRYTLIGDPTEGALLAMARKGGIFPGRDHSVRKIDDLPFNSTLKMRATLTEKDGKRRLLVVGAPEKVLAKASHIMTGEGAQPITEARADAVRDKIESWSEGAMRVIALAYRDEPDGAESIDENNLDGLTFAGITGMIDPPRVDVKESVMACHSAGIRVIMATGDHITTAIAVAKAVGILLPEDVERGGTLAMTETQLLELDDEAFSKAVREINVFSRLTPNMKLRIAEELQAGGELIAMTGDGVNDAPALKRADVGIAMGIMGTDVARDAAAVVLADDNFSTIVKAVEEGRVVFNNTRQASFFLITTNFAEITTLVSAVLMGLAVPLSATQILWLNLVTDGACTTAMAAEDSHGDELSQKPVNREASILNKSILPFLIINSVLMASMALFAFTYYLDEGLDKARTAAFIVMAFSQLFNVFNMRSLRSSIFKVGLFSNGYVNIALVVSVVAQIVIIEVPALAALFNFVSLPAHEFAGLALIPVLVLVFGEIYKYFALEVTGKEVI
ncbi:MAG: HAD-IC family P-type ATPase [Flavobacteriales bacterium]|nr:HAD-IC family P-type ATPase [Flavobacteriales bacterium]